MGRWVYRRPFFRAAKPKIPLHRPGIPAVQRRRRFFQRRRHVVQGHVFVVLGVAAQQATAGHQVVLRPKIRIRIPKPAQAHIKIILNRPNASGPVVLRRVVRLSPKRPQQAHAKIVLKRQQQAGHAIVRVLRRIQKPQRTQPVRRGPAPGGRFEGKQGPLKRILKAIKRMREGMQRRLLFRPREIPPIIPQETIHAISRGEVVMAGAVEGDVFSAGAKRGDVISSHG